MRLLNRTTRSVSLTYAGRIFVAQIKPAFEGIQKAMDIARSQQEAPSGTLRINAFATAAREIMAPLILTYLQRYPQVHVDLVTEGRLIDVVASAVGLLLLSPVLLVLGGVAMVTKYVGLARGEMDMYLMGGVGIAFFMVAGPFLRKLVMVK